MILLTIPAAMSEGASKKGESAPRFK